MKRREGEPCDCAAMMRETQEPSSFVGPDGGNWTLVPGRVQASCSECDPGLMYGLFGRVIPDEMRDELEGKVVDKLLAEVTPE